MGLSSIALAGLAGTLSILSPCVLPLVPLVLGAALSEHRFGVFALATGLAFSFACLANANSSFLRWNSRSGSS